MPSIEFAQPPCRILIVKPSAIGDVVHTLPVLNLLRKRYPTAYIAWMITPTCGGILAGHPQINDTIPFERKKLSRTWALIRALRQGHFDLVIDLQGLFRSGLFTWLSGAAVRVGFANAREMAPMFYTHHVPVPDTEVHAIDRYLSMAEAVGCELSPVEYVFPTDHTDRQAVNAMLGDGSPFAVMLPGTNWATKRWPAEKFAGMASPLKERFGLRTVLAGGPRDGDAVAKLLPDSLNLCGRTSLRQLVALLEKASLVIANDSGPMHIAVALGRPLVTPFGPTNPVRTGPYGRSGSVVRVDLPCSPCYSKICSHKSCMQWLDIDPMLEVARRELNQ